MRVAAVQMCSGVTIDANLEAANMLIRQAATDGARFVTTPEMTHVLQRAPQSLFETLSTEDKDRGVVFFSALAKELNIDLLIGSLAIKTAKRRAVNRSYLFGPFGQIKARYDKIHLFDVELSARETWQESRVYDRGQTAILTEVNGAQIGLSICYDIRFPKLYRHYAQNGADILTVPAAFTRPTGKAHWETLLKARAIETGCFVIAPAQGGQHEDGRATWGRSMIIDPWGQTLARCEDDTPGFICADINLDDVKTVRGKIPAWNYDPEWSV